MHYTARAVWAQFELLLLQQGVLYIKSAAHTTQAKLRMIVPKQKIRFRLDGGCEHNSKSPTILEGWKEVKGTSNIGMPRSLEVPKAGQTLVRVANFSVKVFTLRSDLPVAEYHTVSGVSGSATPTEIGSSPSAPNHPYCSVIDRNIGDDKQESTERENRRAKVIQPSSDGPSEEQKRQFSLPIDQYEGISAMNNCDLG